MAGDYLRRGPHLTMEQFHALRDERPKHEKWELIDGIPAMMPPPTLIHQRIARNLEGMLNDRLVIAKPEWQADREIGVLIPGDETFNPEPDVTVIDAAVAIDQLYAERFYFVAEVLSRSDKPAVLAAKLAYYQQHEHCRGVMFIRQDRVEAELHCRNSSWIKLRLTDPAERIDLVDLGDIGRLGALYRNTPLWQPE